MHNPFDHISNRLDSLEALINRALNQLTVAPPVPEVGGIELAREVTRLSKARIYALVSARGIPHAKRGNKLYFNRAELLDWVASGKRAQA